MEPKYVAKKSAWAGVTFLRVLFFWLIIPLIIMIAKIIILKHETIEFYDGYAIHKKGVLSKSEKRFALAGVAGVSISQSVWQRMCNYGNVYIDIMGRNWDVSTSGIKDPAALKNYLQGLIPTANAQAVFCN